ncbi:MAG: ATP-binding cassette domain-containing protein [Oscillospiraceae bacterium]|nr:ATP-binding cassette domain-containing protein [Oscillospiraceae bacterium]
MEAVKVNNFSFDYAIGNETALHDISFTVNEGEFIVVCGPSGCGKSTLLKSLKPQLKPHGTTRGSIEFYGEDVYSLPDIKTAGEIGFVMQNPDAQIVTDKVWHELAFGLENLGVATPIIRSRVAEMANYFGIHNWFRKKTAELSGGQKQLLNLASVMLMQPKLLILDEPSSQLDPIAAREFLENVRKINLELGTTIIITEHNLEEVYGYADKVLLMENGRVKRYLPPQEMAQYLATEEHEGMYKALPTPARMYGSVLKGECPLSIVEGRSWFSRLVDEKHPSSPVLDEHERPEEKVIDVSEVWFQYEKGSDPVLRDLSFSVRKGEICSILGGNGAGKTTMLSVVSQKRRYNMGSIKISGKELNKYKGVELFEHNMAVLPQNPQSLFVFETLRRDLEEIFTGKKLPKAEVEERVLSMAKKMEVDSLLDRHPYDLSGGEMQKAALAKILLLEPKILLLDEPTKGMDALSKENMGKILRELAAEGKTVLMVTHDIEFCAKYSDHCMLFFDGYIVSEGSPKKFFAENSFYTTAASRMTRHLVQNIITCEEGEKLCRSLL